MSPSGDVERDEILKQRMRLFSWIEPKHLDLPIPSPSSTWSAPASPASPSAAPPSSSSPSIEQAKEREPAPSAASKADEDQPVAVKERKPKGDKVQGFLDFAQRELRKMNQYKAPRDKLICVLNCCKVIFGPSSSRSLAPRSPATDSASRRPHSARLERRPGRRRLHPVPHLHRHPGQPRAPRLEPAVRPLSLFFGSLTASETLTRSLYRYIQRFRNPEKLSGEGGYYLSSLVRPSSFRRPALLVLES